MMYKKNATVLVPSELMYAFDPDNENAFVAAREKGLIVLRPINGCADNQCDVNSKSYQKGYLLGLSEGYHKGYADAMAYEDMQTEGLMEDGDFPDCPGFCKACPHYDNLFDSCKLYT